MLQKCCLADEEFALKDAAGESGDDFESQVGAAIIANEHIVTNLFMQNPGDAVGIANCWDRAIGKGPLE